MRALLTCHKEKEKHISILYYIRGVFEKYVDKCNKMRIMYTRRMKFCINEYELLNTKYYRYEKRIPINDLGIGH